MDRIDETFINALFTPDYYRGYSAVEEYMSKVVLRVLERAGVNGYLRDGYRSVDDVMERFGFHAQSKALVVWAISYLELTGRAERQGSTYKMDPGVPDTGTDEDVKQVLRYIPSSDIFIRLVERIVPDIEDFLHGRKKGGDILFVGETLSLWNDYFNNKFYGYSVLNYGAAYGITKWFSQTRGKRMLEFGSGTSGATVKVFQMLRDNNLLDSMDNIVLSDVVPQLLELGSRNINSHIVPPPSYKQKVLDISVPFEKQGFSEGPFDVVYGVNVMHVARDLSFSFKEIYNHLNDDGILVIAETIRPTDNRPMHHEIIANLIHGYFDVDLDKETRPYHGFLTRELWTRNLETAGFRNIEYISELERHERLGFDIRPLHSFLVLKGQK